MNLGNQSLGFHGFGCWMRATFVSSKHTCFQVIGQELHAERIQGGSNGGDLVQHIDAIPFFFDHALHASDLTGDTFDSPPDLFTDLIFHPKYIYPVPVYAREILPGFLSHFFVAC
jgi:hypothetical protein